MASELERLLLSFEADTRKLREALATAESGVEKFERKADRSLNATERRFQAFGGKVEGALKGIATALAAQFTGQAILGQIGDVAALQKTATVAGVTAEKLQELRAAARLAGVENSELDGVMTKFAVTMGEFRTRTGDFYNFIRNQVPALEAQLMATRNQSDAFDVVADAVSRLRTAEEKALFTKKALGESSVLLISALDGGALGLKNSADEARRYSQVVSEDAVKATAEFKKELDALGASFNASFQNALGKAAPWLTDFTKSLREAWQKGFDIRTVFAEAAAKAGNPEALRQPASVLGLEFGKQVAGFAAKGMQASLKDVLKINPVIPEFKTEGADSQAADALEALRRRHAEIVGDTLGNLSETYQRDVDAFTLALQQKKITEAEYLEARALLNSVSAAKIAEVYDKETAAVRDQLERVKDTIDSTIMRGFEDALRSGKVNFRDMVQDMLVQLTKLAVQAQVVKPILDSVFRPGTGVGNFFGAGASQSGEFISALTALIPGRAAGGPVSAGKPYIVGEKRPELFVPNTSGRIIPSTNVAGGGTVNIDARGADIGVEQRLRAMFMDMQRSQANPVEAMARAQKRFPLRRAA